MKSNLEKICLWSLYALIGITLAVPLAFDSGFFFPFITTKVLLFRLVIEIMVPVYLLLVFSNITYRPRVNILFLIACAFTAVAFVSSFLGPDFYMSFWGDTERGEGLILWVHLLAYFLILISVLRSKKEWAYFFHISLVVAFFVSLFALGQHLELKNLSRTTGSRVEATFGNPAFFAAYLIFHVAFVTYFIKKTKSIPLRTVYTILLGLFLFIIFQTQVRGAALGIFFGVLASACVYIFKEQNNKKARQYAIGVLAVFIGFSVFLYGVRDTEWIKSSSLNRLASISTQQRTAQTRLVTWKAAWQGWREKFLFGHGVENFNLVFDKYFPAIIYEDEGSRIWFDRAHNMIFDRGVTTGVFGLVLFLAFLLLPFIVIFRLVSKKDNRKESSNAFFKFFSIPTYRDEWLGVVGIFLITAYIVQNMFVFEAITTYAILFFTYAFISTLYNQYKVPKKFLSGNVYLVSAITMAVAMVPFARGVNIVPGQANRMLALAKQEDATSGDFFKVTDLYKKAIETGSYGTPDFQLQYLEYVGNTLTNVGKVFENVLPVLAHADTVADEYALTNNSDVKAHLVTMRHYNLTYGAIDDQELIRLDKAMSHFTAMEELAPNRPHIYFEAGFNNLFRYRFLVDNKGEEEDIKKALSEAEKYFTLGLEKSKNVVEPYLHLIMLYLNTGNDQGVSAILEAMEEAGVPYKNATHLSRIKNNARSNERYHWAAYFSEELFKIDPLNLQAYREAALGYALSGETEKAIEIAEKSKEIGDDVHDAEVDEFIEKVRSGEINNGG